MMGRPAAGRDGFTLVEVLVALVIASIAMAAGFGALTIVGDQSRRAEESTVAILEGRTTRELLHTWLSSARLQSNQQGMEFQGLDAFENGLVSDELLFPTTAMTPLRVSVSFVRLYIDTDVLTPEQGLVAEITERLTDVPKRVELVPQAVGIEMRFLSEVEGIDEWLPSWIGRAELPRAVELTILGPFDQLPPLLTLPIRVALGAAQ